MDEAGVGIDVDELDALRQQAQRAAELEAQNASLQRDLAFQRAGVDATTEPGRIFARGYDGELTAEAIRAQADSFFRTQSPDRAEVEALERMSRTAEAPPAAEEDWVALLGKANSVDEVMALATQRNLPTVHNRPA